MLNNGWQDANWNWEDVVGFVKKNTSNPIPISSSNGALLSLYQVVTKDLTRLRFRVDHGIHLHSKALQLKLGSNDLMHIATYAAFHAMISTVASKSCAPLFSFPRCP